jgi:hypothetical protein
MCDEHLDQARTLSVAAGAAIGGAIVAVVVAIALNGGVFTAPGAVIPMIIAGTAAGSAAGLLRAGLKALELYIACGGLHPTCDGKFYNLRNGVTGAATAAGAWSGACFATAGIAWIPWAGGVPMAAALAGLLVTSAAIAAVAYQWTQVRDCSTSMARVAGRLEPGERLSDPWWLRLRPVTGRREYAWPESEHLHLLPGTEEGRVRLDVYGSEKSCGRYTIGEWRLEAVARVAGTVTGPIAFSWTLDGEPLPATTDSSGRESTLSTTVPPRLPVVSMGIGRDPVTAESELQVTARDTATGRVVAKSEMVVLPKEKQICFGRLVLPLLPLELDSPIYESRIRTRLEYAGAALVRAIRVANPIPRGVAGAAGGIAGRGPRLRGVEAGVDDLAVEDLR